tara:strand:- start:2 stop:142 length:141 start_codon:yes stop_codon:yes gene_type:complete
MVKKKNLTDIISDTRKLRKTAFLTFASSGAVQNSGFLYTACNRRIL